MNYCGYSPCDLANGVGARVSLFVSGCSLHCKGCFSPSTWDRNYGKEFDTPAKERLFDDLSNKFIAGLSILGGDPLEPYNIEPITQLCKEIKEKFPEKTIWLWTGRKKEKVINLPIMQYLDIVVSGPYIEKYNTNNTKYRGSSNQEIWWAKNGEPYESENLVGVAYQNTFLEFGEKI